MLGIHFTPTVSTPPPTKAGLAIIRPREFSIGGGPQRIVD